MTTINLSIDLTTEQLTGVSQARTAYNLANNVTLTDSEYLEFVLLGAANSYIEQYSGSDPVEPSPVESAPKKIDARRLRLALLELNLFDTIEAAIASQGKAAQLEWEFASTISETHPLVIKLVSALNLNVDQIFDLAESYQ